MMMSIPAAKRLMTLAALALSLPLCHASAQELPLPVSEIQRDEPVDFGKEIVPLLKRNCLACHHAKETEGGLNLETHAGMMKGGDSGPGVVPKDVEASLLLTRATGAEEPLMPPEDNSVGAKPFTPEELGLIQLWISQGAPEGAAMTSQPIQWQPIPESIRTIYAMDVSADGNLLATGRGNRVALFDLHSGNEIGRLVDPSLSDESAGQVADIDLIQSIAFAPDGYRIATGGYRTVKLWNKTHQQLTAEQSVLAAASGLIAMKGDQTSLAMVNAIGDIEVWSVKDRQRQHTLSGHSDRIAGLAWTNDRIFSCDGGGRLLVWDANSGNQLAIVEAETPLHSLTVTQDGGTVAAINQQRQVLLWQVNPGEEGKLTLAAKELEAAKPITDALAALLTQKPSPLLALASEAGGVQLINLTDGKLARKIDHGSIVNALAVSGDGSQLATAGKDGKTRTWNLADGKPVQTFQGDPELRIQLASALADSARQKAAVARLTAHTAALEKVVTSENEALKKVTEERDKATEAVAAEEKKRVDAAAKVAETEAAIAKAKTDSETATKTLTASQALLTAASASSTKMTGEMQAKTELLAKANEAATKAQQQVDAANKALASAKAEAEKLSQEIAAQKAAIAKAGEDAKKAQVAIDTANKTIAAAKTATENATKQLEAQKKALTAAVEAKTKSETNLAKRQQAFDTATLAQKRAVAAIPAHQAVIAKETRRQQVLDQHLAGVQSRSSDPANSVVGVAFNADNSKIAAVGKQGEVTVYRVSDASPLSSHSAPSDRSRHVLFGPDEEIGVYGQFGASVAWSLQPSWQLERTIGSPNDSPISDRVTALDFRPDGLTIAVGSGPPSRSGEVLIFATQTGQLLRDFGEIHSDTVLGLRFSPDGRLLASSAADKTVRLLDIGGGTVIRSLEGHTHHVLSLDWQDDGQTIASASADQNIKVWNVETGEQRRTIAGFPKEITAIAFVATTNQVITSCADGNVRLHDTGNGKSLRSFNAGGDFLFALTVTPDGKTLIAGGQSGAIRVWNLADGKLIREWK